MYGSNQHAAKQNPMGDGPTGSDESDVSASMSALSRQITFLQEAVGHLSDRLEPVKRDNLPVTTGATLMSNPMSGGNCQLSSEIVNMTCRLEGVASKIQENLNLLQL